MVIAGGVKNRVVPEKSRKPKKEEDKAELYRKPKTQRGKRAVEHRAAKLHENPKQTIFVKGGRTSELITQCLKDLCTLKKPLSVHLKRLEIITSYVQQVVCKNPFHPFDDDTEIEKFAMKYDCSLFCFGSHSKKRPHNLVLGRLFDFHLLDMIEFGMENFREIASFQIRLIPIACTHVNNDYRTVLRVEDLTISMNRLKMVEKCAAGVKPCLTFAGELFQSDAIYKRIKNLFLDLFRVEEAENLTLQGVQTLISFTAHQGKIFLRTYRILLKKSGSRTPRIELEEMGPCMDLSVRRHKLASDDHFKAACRQPKQAQIKQRKNVSRDVFGTELGRVHLGKQQLDTIQTRKTKALRNTSRTMGTNATSNTQQDDHQVDQS